MAYDPWDEYGRVHAMTPRCRGGTRKGTKRWPLGNYKETIWWKMIHTGEVKDPTSKVGKLFRKRFRIPFPVFTQIMERVCREEWFPETERQLQSKNWIPLELKVLGFFRVLGRGVGFNDIAEITASSAATHCLLFHEFCSKMVMLYDEFIIPPKTQDEIDRVTLVYKLKGLPGCIGSIDCIHVPWENCPAMWRSLYQGKEGHPAVAY